MLIDSQREAFSIPREVAYLNCAYISPLLNSSAKAIEKGKALEQSPWKIKPDDFFDPGEEARALFAELIDAQADDIALVPSASYGTAVAARNLPLAKGQELLLLEGTYPSNVFCWWQAAEEAGAEVRFVPRPSDGDWTSAVLAQISPRTALASLPHVYWMDGALLDLLAISKTLKAQGAALSLDLSQSLGALPFSVREVDPDFMTTAGYKWMLCPYTVSFLYVAARWQGGQPIEFNALNRANHRDFAKLANYSADYAPGARRFDVGEKAQFTLLPGAIESLKQVLAWDPARIQSTLAAKTRDIADWGREWGFIGLPEGRRAGHFLGLRRAEGLPENLLERLQRAEVYLSLRGDSLRVTPHLYNDEEDVARLKSLLQESL